MFNKNGNIYCDDCLDKNEKEQDLIIDYVRKHPDNTILDIIIETGVTLKSINCLVADGYVSYVDNKISKIDDEDLNKVMDKLIDRKGRFHRIREN